MIAEIVILAGGFGIGFIFGKLFERKQQERANIDAMKLARRLYSLRGV